MWGMHSNWFQLTFTYQQSQNHYLWKNNQYNRKYRIALLIVRVLLLSPDSKVKTTLYNTINSTKGKYCWAAFIEWLHLRICPQAQKLKPPRGYDTKNNTARKKYSVAFAWLVKPQDLVHTDSGLRNTSNMINYTSRKNSLCQALK